MLRLHLCTFRQVFDSAGRGEVDADVFRAQMPYLGEELPPEKLEKLFREADEDGSGRSAVQC